MTHPDERKKSVSLTFGRAIALVRGRLVALVVFALAFRVIHFVLLAPLATWILRLFLQRTGRASVGNFEIASFLLSPTGIIAICSVGAIISATLYLEMSGLMQIMLKSNFHWWSFRGRYVALFQRLLRLGAIQLAVSTAIVLPFAGVVYAIYAALWNERDLNGLIVLKPAEFWWGVGLAGVVVASLAVVLVALHLRWLLSVPVILCEQETLPIRALAASRKHTRKHAALILKCLTLWFAILFGSAYCLLAVVHLALLQLLAYPWQSLSTAALVTGVTLTTEFLIGALLSLVSNIGLAATILALYESIVGKVSIDENTTASEPSAAPQFAYKGLTRRRWILAASSILIASAVAVSYWICDTLKLKDTIAITAHRAGAAHAPENTVAAIRRAIQDKADWAEIDVQLTSDEEIVVMHDTDLARIGGGKAAVGKSTLAQIQALDLGSLFSPEFQGERVPTFQELLQAAKGKIRLNVELKPHGAADTEQLTKNVVAAIQSAEMVAQCRICSQSYEGIQLARKLEPNIEIGFIAATALGDTTKLDVNFLMLSHSKISRTLVERAQARGIKIHAWTVNDPNLVLKLVDAGVSNIITDDVVRISQQLKAIETLEPVERLLLRVKNGLTSNVAIPETGEKRDSVVSE